MSQLQKYIIAGVVAGVVIGGGIFGYKKASSKSK